MAPELVPAPTATAAPTTPAINKIGLPNQKRTSQKILFSGKKNKMQGNPTLVKYADVKFARSNAKRSSKPNSLPGYKVVYEKEIRLEIKALLI